MAAISAALRSDAALAALVGQRIYDAPPARAVMPSIAIRLVTAHDASTSNTEAQTLVFDLDVWDRYDYRRDARPPAKHHGAYSAYSAYADYSPSLV